MASGRFQAWVLAARPATLTAAVVPVVVGSALAARDGVLRVGPAGAALGAALLIQIGTNLVNDVDDFERGADTAARRGPTRVTQSGLLTAREVRRAAWIAFGAAAVLGLYLVAHAGWPILALGITAIASGIAYTGGPWPLGYRGLGDFFVFAFFGVAAVVGTYYVQAGATAISVWVASIPVGALATAILVVNNVRDHDTDRIAGKRTLVVQWGERAGRAEFIGLLALAYFVPFGLALTHLYSSWILLPWFTAPWAIMLGRSMATCTDTPAFNPILRSTARLHLLFGLLLAAGLLCAA
jgi:1,4-dihydroxy-2-naphthoate octaprenyltransferase